MATRKQIRVMRKAFIADGYAEGNEICTAALNGDQDALALCHRAWLEFDESLQDDVNERRGDRIWTCQKR